MFSLCFPFFCFLDHAVCFYFLYMSICVLSNEIENIRLTILIVMRMGKTMMQVTRLILGCQSVCEISWTKLFWVPIPRISSLGQECLFLTTEVSVSAILSGWYHMLTDHLKFGPPATQIDQHLNYLYYSKLTNNIAILRIYLLQVLLNSQFLPMGYSSIGTSSPL